MGLNDLQGIEDLSLSVAFLRNNASAQVPSAARLCEGALSGWFRQQDLLEDSAGCDRSFKRTGQEFVALSIVEAYGFAACA